MRTQNLAVKDNTATRAIITEVEKVEKVSLLTKFRNYFKLVEEDSYSDEEELTAFEDKILRNPMYALPVAGIAAVALWLIYIGASILF